MARNEIELNMSTKTEIYFMRNCRKLRRNTSDRERQLFLPSVMVFLFFLSAQLPSSLSSQSPSHITDMHHIKAVPIMSINRPNMVHRECRRYLSDLPVGQSWGRASIKGTVELSYSEVESPPKL